MAFYKHSQNNETHVKYYGKVACLMYTEMINFRPQKSENQFRNKNHTGD